MPKGRIEAFSDGVIAILITIMVLELRVPSGPTWHALGKDLSLLGAYALSFIYLGIYWNNHHHMLAAVTKISGAALWANLHLLFWLSLIPFTTEWMSHSDFPTTPVVCYGIVLLMAGVSFLILQTMLLRAEGSESRLRVAIGSDLKGKGSAALYCLGIGLAFLDRWVGLVIFIAVAGLWFVPDRRVERQFNSSLVSAPADAPEGDE